MSKTLIDTEGKSFTASFSSNSSALQKITYCTPHALMLLFLFFSPFTQYTSINEICFYISSGLFLFSVCSRQTWIVLRTPLAIVFLLFLLWAVAGIPTALNKPNTVHDIYAHWIKYVVIYYLLVNYFQKPGELVRLATLIVITGCVYSVWYIAYFYFYLGNSWSARLVMYPYRDYFFTFSSMIAIGLIQHHKTAVLRALFTLALLCILVAAILSQSRNVLLAVVIGSLIYMLKYPKTALCLLLAVIISVAAFPAFRERLKWGTLISSDRISTNLITSEIIKHYPLFGIGFGMQTYGYPEFIDLQAYNKKIPKQFQKGVILGSPHNLLMDVTVRTGILGGLFFLAIYWIEGMMLYSIYRRSQNAGIKRWGLVLAASFAAFLIQSLFGDAAFSIQAIIFFVILSMTTILWRQYQRASLRD